MISTMILMAALLTPQETELRARLPGIVANSAAHYRALDAAATPLMTDEKGDHRLPRGWDAKAGKPDMHGIYDWTSGHYPGSLWYLHELTGEAFFRERATVWTELLAPIAAYDGNHDIGFMVYCSYGNARRLLKTDRYDALLLQAADSLSHRYNPALGLVRSWGEIGEKENFYVIPDNMMNLELLAWASKNGGGARFDEIARSHANVTMRHQFRPDGGVRHVLDYDQETKRVKGIERGQGASCETAWSRGQAWAIYGYSMMFRETGDVRFRDFACKLADYAIGHPNMPEDGVPYWDYGAPGEERDSSAAAVMASGLLELSGSVVGEGGARYRAFAVKQLLSLSSPAYFNAPGENGDWLLKHGVGNKPGNSQIDTPLNYGDYYFLEALARFKRSAAASPDDAAYANIEREVADAVRRIDVLQAKLTDRVLLTSYGDLVREGDVWTDALQRALDEHEVVVVPPSETPYLVDAPVLVPSNRRIEAKGATVRLKEGTRTLLLRNARAADGSLAPIPSGRRDANIAVVGGRWEDWMRKRGGYGSTGRFDKGACDPGSGYGVSALFFFNNCDDVSVTDATFVHCSGFAVQTGDGDGRRFERIRFDQCHADGLHLNGNLARVLCRDVRGVVGDDLVALNAYDWQDSSVDFGPQRYVLCEDLELLGGYPTIRLLPAVYRYRDGTKVDCSISDVIFRRVKGVSTYKMYVQTPRYGIGGPREWGEVGSGGNLFFEQLDIDLAEPCDMLGGYAASDPVRGHFGAFEFGANLTNVRFKDIDITFHADKWPLSHLATVGPKSCVLEDKKGGTVEIFDPWVSCSVGCVTLENVRAHGAVPSELIHAVSFEDVNADGASSGRGTICKLDRNNVVDQESGKGVLNL